MTPDSLLAIADAIATVPPAGALSLRADLLPGLLSCLSPDDDEPRGFISFDDIMVRPDGEGGAIFARAASFREGTDDADGGGVVSAETATVDTAGDEGWRQICFHVNGPALVTRTTHPFPLASFCLTRGLRPDMLGVVMRVTPTADDEGGLSAAKHAFAHICTRASQAFMEVASDA